MRAVLRPRKSLIAYWTLEWFGLCICREDGLISRYLSDGKLQNRGMLDSLSANGKGNTYGSAHDERGGPAACTSACKSHTGTGQSPGRQVFRGTAFGRLCSPSLSYSRVRGSEVEKADGSRAVGEEVCMWRRRSSWRLPTEPLPVGTIEDLAWVMGGATGLQRGL